MSSRFGALYRFTLMAILLLLGRGSAEAGLTVTPLGAKLPSTLVANLAGTGITYSNVVYLGTQPK